MKQAKLIAGLNSLLKNSNQYQFQYSNTMTYQCTIKQLYQQQLQNKYPEITLQDITKQFQQYLFLPGQLLGKRSSEIMVSSSKKYCCKLIDQDTLQKLIEIRADLCAHQQNNKDSYLIDIYRIFIVESVKDNFRQSDVFTILPCLRPNFQDSIAIYDIKGHTQARNLDKKDFQIFKFGKDENFISCKELELIQKIHSQQRKKFVQVIARDANFLMSKNIIDYSLLLSFRKEKQNQNIKNFKIRNCINIGNGIIMEWFIIDYFQEYNQKKKVQNKFKSLFRKQVSSVEPNIYAERFINFVKKYFLI